MIDRRSVIASAVPAALLPGAAIASPLPMVSDASSGSSVGTPTAGRDALLCALWQDIESFGAEAFSDFPDDDPLLARWRAASGVDDKNSLGIAWRLHMHIGTLLDCSALTAGERRAIRQALAMFDAAAAEPRRSA